MPTSDPGNLVSTDWLGQHLNAPDVRMVDASWYLPGQQRDPRAEYENAHIPGAVFFDIDEISDLDSPYPHMLPSPEKFSSRVRKLGLGDGNRIIVYDGAGVLSSARVWWMFRAMGHHDVAVLDGGLPKWKAEDRPLSDYPPTPRERHFTARQDNTCVRTAQEVLKTVGDGSTVILDARSEGRFRGTAPEPREGLRSGHIPGSKSLPFDGLFKADGTMKDAESLREIFSRAGAGGPGQVITSCGSGVTAAVLALGLDLIGHKQVAVYDGSWTEWGSRDDLPVESG